MAEKDSFKVLIVDDEPDARSLLHSLCDEMDNVEVVAEASQCEEAFYLILDLIPDLILLDINMPGKTGMKMTTLMQKRMMDIPVVFVSAHKEYAIEAIQNGVYDFLLKPVSREELAQKIEKYRRLNLKFFPGRVIEMVNTIPEEVKIKINSRHSYVLINPDEILYCEAHDGNTFIFMTNGKKETANSSLAQIGKKVQKWNFFRLGRSFLLNLDYIRYLDKSKNICILKSESTARELVSSNQSIKELLQSKFNYA